MGADLQENEVAHTELQQVLVAAMYTTLVVSKRPIEAAICRCKRCKIAEKNKLSAIFLVYV